MKQKKSTVSRYFDTLFKFIFTCLAVYGIFMIAVGSKLYKNEQFTTLENNSNFFIGGLNNEFQMYHSIDTVSSHNQHRDFMKTYEMRIFVYDENGECILAPDDEENTPLSNTIKQKISQENFLNYDAGKLSGKKQSILFGKKFTIHCDKHDDDVIFYMTAYSSITDIDSYNIKLFLSAIVVFLAFIIPSFFIIRTQKERNLGFFDQFRKIVRQYSTGDFSEKLDTDIPKDFRETCLCINHLADSIKNADETSRTFVSNVSHELRTPLTTIGGFIDGILDGTIPKNRQTEYLNIISNEVKRLNLVISSMLNLSRFEKGTLKVNFRPTNINDLVINVVLIFEKRIEEKKIEIEGLGADRITAEIDPELIKQVVYNLVENAVKFIDDGGTLSFRFEAEGDFVTFSIRNTGEGLENNEMQQIFDRFYKTDSSRGKDITGLGLGLNISKQIVNLHNGKITVRSVKGEYTEFSVQLPAVQSDRKE